MSIEDLLLSREDQEENLRVYEESKKYLYTKPSEWSFIEPVWDFSKDGQRFASIGRTKEALTRAHPNGLLLGILDFDELDTRLVTIFRRKPSELWTAHSNSSLSRIIFHWSERKALTPPLLRVFKEFGPHEITITDGSHRLAIARALNIKRLPILIDLNEYFEIKKLLPSLELISMP